MGDDEFVQPSGKVTDTGEPIYEAKPTATTVQQQVSEGRVQTFGSGGGKISDTQRVAVTSGGETKWVTPEKAKFQSAKGTLKFKEAEKKIKAKEELRETIKQRITKQQKPSILKEREEREAEILEMEHVENLINQLMERFPKIPFLELRRIVQTERGKTPMKINELNLSSETLSVLSGILNVLKGGK